MNFNGIEITEEYDNHGPDCLLTTYVVKHLKKTVLRTQSRIIAFDFWKEFAPKKQLTFTDKKLKKNFLTVLKK